MAREKNEIGKRLLIRQVAKLKGITLKAIAEKMGIAYVGLIQKLDGNMTTQTLYDIADILHCSPADFFPTGNESGEKEKVDVAATDIYADMDGMLTLAPADESKEYRVKVKDIFRVLSE